MFPYNKWVPAGEDTGRIAVLPTSPCRYTLVIQTAFSLLAGTSSEIRAILHGRADSGASMSQPLLLKHKCDDVKLFARGSLNVFSVLAVGDVGDVQSVELLSDGSGMAAGVVCDV